MVRLIRLPARATLITLMGLLLIVSALAAEPAAYRRQDWKHWLRSPTEPCRSVRDEVMIRDFDPRNPRDERLNDPSSWMPMFLHHMTVGLARGECRISAGKWKDAYSGQLIIGPSSLLDVDHVIPLKWAHDHGAADWPKTRKAAYANYLDYRRHLIPTATALNRQKGAKGPDEWTPPDPAAHCQYGESWATVIVIHGLTPTPAVRAAIRDLVKGCGPFGRDQ